MSVNHGEAFVAECHRCTAKRVFGTAQDASKWADHHIEDDCASLRPEVEIRPVSWYYRREP